MVNIGLCFENLNLAVKQCYHTGNLGILISVICISKENFLYNLSICGGEVRGAIQVSGGCTGAWGVRGASVGRV